jgi:tRNA-Thr(GGU) m(6)t(6)A37 methyltransferase TsaA
VSHNSSQFSIEPIGWVHNEVKEPLRRGWEGMVSEIVLKAELAQAIEGLEGFSHIIVLFWMHRIPKGMSPPAKVHPQGRADLPLVGLFATRAPYRPNPIGLSVVRLLERKGNVLRVEGLDAIDGTPVLDIKPYFLPSLAQVRVPQWANCGSFR